MLPRYSQNIPECAEVQQGTKFLCLTEWRKELNHLHITCCLLSLFNFPKFPYTFHTSSNVSVPHIHESLGVGKKDSSVKKCNHQSGGTLPFPVLKRTPPRKILLESDSLSHTVSSRQTLRISLEFKPLKEKVWFHWGFTLFFIMGVLCFVALLSSGRRYLGDIKKENWICR